MTKLPHSKAKALAIYLLKVITLAVVYHLAARLGLKMAYVQVNTSPVWPPTGIALAALLAFGYNLWPGVSLGVLLGSLLTGAPLDIALGMTLGNTLEALAGAFFLKRFVGFHNEIDRIQDVVGLVLVSVFSTAISATIGTATLMLTGGVGQEYIAIWPTWWIGDLLGALVVAPVLLTWVTLPSFQVNKRAYLEGGILLMLLAWVTWYVFSNQPPIGVFHQAMIYVIFPFMIWAALRLGQRGAATAIFLVSGIAIWGTSQGMGPFSLESKNDSLVLLQTFMGVVSLTSLILAAATIERRKAAEALRQRIDDLAVLNDSSKSFLDNSDLTSIYQTICQLAVTRLGVEAAWIETMSHEEPEARPAAAYGINIEAIAGLKAWWEKDSLPQDRGGVFIKTSDDLAQTSFRADSPYHSYAVVPLVFSNELLGVLRLMSKGKAFFTEDRQLLIQSYANLAAVAIQNTWLFEEVRRGNKQLHALSQRLMKAQEDERLHLSRELHDESGQLLAALMVQLGLLEREASQAGGVRD
ncbi:MAG: MASE1 domain-containing protein, partial [Anaerolineales bacterium]|nr:MASE1 domain-containing protein [Anaerolineales bacterium]